MRNTSRGRHRLLGALLFTGALSPSAFAQIGDDFVGTTPNPLLWNTGTSGGPTISQGGGKVTAVLPASSAGSIFYAGYTSVPQLTGDFDFQIDYALPEWPTANGVRVGLSVLFSNGTSGAVERTSFGNNDYDGNPREVYLTDFPSERVQGIVATTDRSGTLRLTRTGSVLTGYFWDAGHSLWSAVHSSPTSTEAVGFGFSAWSHDYAFTARQATVEFSNFRVNSGATNGGGGQNAGDPVPEPSEWAAMGVLGAGLGALVLKRRRTR